MDLSPKNSMIGIPNLRHRLRQLRWFIKAFRNNAELIEQHFGVCYHVDEKALHEAFFNWIALLESQDTIAKSNRADYIIFVGGLALSCLIQANPAKAAGGVTAGVSSANADIIGFWPEGFLYTNFCICAVAAVREQEGEKVIDLAQTASELRTWWSFRENAGEDPALAIPFLDKFLGTEPNWQFPSSASQREAIRSAVAIAETARIAEP